MADVYPSIPQDPEARALIVGSAIAADYAIAAWSNVLMWPAKQAPHCMKHPKAPTVTILIVTVQTNMDGRHRRPS